MYITVHQMRFAPPRWGPHQWFVNVQVKTIHTSSCVGPITMYKTLKNILHILCHRSNLWSRNQCIMHFQHVHYCVINSTCKVIAYINMWRYVRRGRLRMTRVLIRPLRLRIRELVSIATIRIEHVDCSLSRSYRGMEALWRLPPYCGVAWVRCRICMQWK